LESQHLGNEKPIFLKFPIPRASSSYRESTVVLELHKFK